MLRGQKTTRMLSSINSHLPNTFPRYVDGIMYLENVAIEEIVANFEDSLLLYSTMQLKHNAKHVLHSLGQAAKTTEVFYAYKACPLPDVTKLLHESGIGAEVGSAYEYQMAVCNGCAPSKIVWNSVCKSHAEIQLALAGGVRIWHIDAIEEAYLLNKALEGTGRMQDIAVRVFPNIETNYIKPGSKLGNPVVSGDAKNVCRQISQLNNLRLVGLHCHTMVKQRSAQAYADLARSMVNFAKEIQYLCSVKIQYINLGGGFLSTSCFASHSNQLKEIGRAIAQETKEFTGALAFEPGRCLVNNAAVAVGCLLAKKEYSKKTWWITNINTSILVPFEGRDFSIIPGIIDTSQPKVCVSIGDRASSYSAVLSENTIIQNCDVNATLVVTDCGAYTYSARQGFIYPHNRVGIVNGNNIRICQET